MWFYSGVPKPLKKQNYNLNGLCGHNIIEPNCTPTVGLEKNH